MHATRHARFAQSVALLSALSLAACDADRTTAPGADVRLSANGAPSSLTASPVSSTSISLSWSENSTNETGVEVHRSTTGSTGTFGLLVTLAANASSHTDGALTPVTQYCYKVRTVRVKGRTTYSAFSDVACATTPAPPGPPAAPSDVAASPFDDYRFRISWRDNSTDEQGFRVEHSPTGEDPWTLLATLQPGTTSYVDSRYGTAEQLQCYRVTAYNAAGPATPAADCTVRPAAPSELRTADSASFIHLTWRDNSAYEDGYEVLRSTSGTSLVAIAQLPAGAVEHRDAAVTPDVRYTYSVRAKRDGGFSGWSGTQAGMIVTSPPPAPTTARATTSGSTSVWVQWTYASSNEQGFRVERSVDGGGSWTTAVIYETIWQTTFRDDGRTPEVSACYRVYARNSAGESPPSPVDCAIPLAPPADLVATAIASDRIELRWRDASAIERGYEVMRETCGYYLYYGEYIWYCFFETVARLDAGATSWIATGLASGTSHTFVVVTVGDEDGYAAYSDWSNPASATTP